MLAYAYFWEKQKLLKQEVWGGEKGECERNWENNREEVQGKRTGIHFNSEIYVLDYTGMAIISSFYMPYRNKKTIFLMMQ